MGKNALIAILGSVILLVLVYILLPDTWSAVYASGNDFLGVEYTTFKYPMLGTIAALIDVAFRNDFSQMYLIIWGGTGLALGLARRSGGGGFAIGFYIGIYLMMLYYIILILNDIYILPITLYDEYVFIVGIIYPAVANGIFCGLIGGIGGKITKPRKKKLTPVFTEKILALFPMTCPNCGAQFYSNAKYCSTCGAEMPKMTLKGAEAAAEGSTPSQ